MSKKKSSKAASGQPGPTQPEKGSSVGDGKSEDEPKGKPTEEVQPQGTATTPTPEPAKELTPNLPKKLTFSDVLHELETLKQIVLHHTEQLAEIESRLTKPRKTTSPASRTRVQIRDKQTGIIYPSQTKLIRLC